MRREHREELRVLLEDGLKHFDCIPLADTLAKAGVPCAPIQDIGQSLSHQHTAHRGSKGCFQQEWQLGNSKEG